MATQGRGSLRASIRVDSGKSAPGCSAQRNSLSIDWAVYLLRKPLASLLSHSSGGRLTLCVTTSNPKDDSRFSMLRAKQEPSVKIASPGRVKLGAGSTLTSPCSREPSRRPFDHRDSGLRRQLLCACWLPIRKSSRRNL